MILSITVGISVGLIQIDRLADAWTDLSGAETSGKEKETLCLRYILSWLNEGPLETVLFYLPPHKRAPNKPVNPTRNPRARA